MKTVGQTYKKNNHAGLTYQLITFPNFVRVSAIAVHVNEDRSHELTITAMHINKCFRYVNFLASG